MPLTPGTSIGPYEIVGWLGAGGMGVVYRARDARLGREVAIKLIAEELATDAMRVRRFEQEARAAGQLNHPNILAVYDLGIHAGAPYIVSELLEGESLRSLLTRGPVPSRKAIDYARQIAEGLAAAHGKGIVHRDVKPDNLFITNDGRIKILDFGIAKLTQPMDDATRHTGFETETGTGMVVGTAGYMSPEQVRGEAVDARSDIFSFGAVLYEMLAGRSAFARGTAAETMAAVLKEDPPRLGAKNVSPLPAPALVLIVSRCLEKAREMRFQSARDLAFGLEYLSGANATAASALAPDVSAGTLAKADLSAGASAKADRGSWLRWRGLPWVVGGAVAVLLAGTAAWNLRRPLPRLAVTRFLLTLPAGQELDRSGGAHVVALSPDGSQIAYVATPFRLYLRSMSEVDAKAIPGTETYEGVREPVFSPDGASIAFYAFADQTLKRMAVTGGAAVTICPAETPTGISWGPDGIVFGQGRKGILRVSPNGGTPELIVRVSDGEEAHGPQILPDGQHVMFTLATGSTRDRWDKAHIVVQSLTSGERRPLLVGSDARYIPTGHLVYALGGSVFAVAFDAQQREVQGVAVPIIEGVSRAAGAFTGAANFSFSNTGSLVYVPSPVSTSLALLDIALMDRTGEVTPLKLRPGPYVFPRVSRDGGRIAFGTDDGKEAIVWTYDLSGKGPMQRLTFGGNNRFPTWTSDGTRIAVQSDRDSDLAIFWQRADGTGTAERLTKPDQGESHAPESWSPTQDTLLFSITKGSDVSLWTLSVQDGKVALYGAVRSSTTTGAVFSPDGRWVAYASTERGLATTLYVQPFPATGTRYPLFAKPTDSPKHPLWSRDGKELIYNPRTAGIEAVSIVTQPTFAFGNPVSVPKRIGGGPPGSRTPYDITPDGKLVGLITAGQGEYAPGSKDQFQVVLNWFEDLKARVPQH